MFNSRHLFGVLPKKQEILISFRNFQVFQVYNAGNRVPNVGQHADRSLFFTNLPKPKRERKRKLKEIPRGPIIIQCKHENLNHYSGMHYGKFDVVPLASKGWYHRRSKGDYFTIFPTKPHPAFHTKEDLPDTFEENGISEEIINQLKKVNVFYPTVVQAKSIQSLLTGQNVFVSSECGSGKTLTYLIATVENVFRLKKAVGSNKIYNSPFAIVLVPVRELALQVGVLANKLCSDLGINCQILVGGNTDELLKHPQQSFIDILICTPNVLKRHLRANLYSAEQCKHLVIDEADTLLERSFFHDMKYLFHLTKLKFDPLSGPYGEGCSQICFVSGTAPVEIEPRLQELIKMQDIVTVSTPNLHKTVSHIRQSFLRVGKNERETELLKFAKSMTKQKIPTLIFSNSVATSNWVSHFLSENNVKCLLLNNTHETEDRLRTIRDLEDGTVDVMSCTDLASRGLHFERLKRVLNYEFPSYMTDYIHRCGRVGRLGQGDDCLITNFISSRHEIPLLNKIEMAVRTNSTLSGIRSDRGKIYIPPRRKMGGQ